MLRSRPGLSEASSHLPALALAPECKLCKKQLEAMRAVHLVRAPVRAASVRVQAPTIVCNCISSVRWR